MNHQQGYLNRVKNEKIYYQFWLPAKKSQATVILVHGLGSHSGWYNELAHKLVEQNFSAYALDLYGHGKSSGQRGYIKSWADYRQNLDDFVNWVKSQQPQQPRYIVLGTSKPASGSGLFKPRHRSRRSEFGQSPGCGIRTTQTGLFRHHFQHHRCDAVPAPTGCCKQR